MANEFFTILTATGKAKLAAATATMTPLSLTHMAVGDGHNGAYYSPVESQTALRHETWRGAINHLSVDADNPNWIVTELVIPDDVGGFYIREVGLFDDAGALIAIGKFPESYKPTLSSGSNKQLYVRVILEVSNTSAVTLKVDPSIVLATCQFVADSVGKAIGVHEKAADPHSQYATDEALTQGLASKLGKTETAADSEKLGGQLPEHYAKASDLAKAGGDPLLWPRTSPSRTHIQAGYAPLDGQELSRALYPDAWAAIQSGAVPVVTEAEWQDDPLKRGAWTYGNGTTTFRMPDWNGKSAGSKGAVFVRGDGALSAGAPGRIQGDAIRNITGRFIGRTPAPDASGAISISGVASQAYGGSAMATQSEVSFDASRVVPTADENRPVAVTGVWVCRLFGVVTNPSSADAAQLASKVARLWAQFAGKLDVSAAFGHGQEWRDVSSERRCGVTYTNTTGRAILVRITAHAAIQPFVDGKAIGGVGYGSVTIVDTIPVSAGKTYSNNGSSFLTWQEWR